uniref:Lipase domain-containing protein n=1 Tax=Glossina pallidipes TaxID=7398 RepID=A0A1A9ZP98_GLOPL
MTIAASSALCRIFTFFLAGSPIFYSPTPRGYCSNCCEIKERDDIKFMLYTRENPFKTQYLYLSDERRLRKSNFNFNYPLAIYLHGFSESATGEKQSSQELKDAFLKRGNYNVILIDWSAMTAVPWYTNAVDNMNVVARYVARFIRFLVMQGYPVQRVHLIGFSLGAEVAGFIGKQLQEWGINLKRITGLDPALPLFDDNSSNRRLKPSDAYFVDVIHTDGGILGNPEAMGHVDFYPNGGHALQPGCARQEIANNRWLGILVGCSHQRAWEYFIESIHYPLAFEANRCEPSKLFGICQHDGNGKAYMGMGADQRLRGKYFLDTNDETPYGRNALGRVLKLSSAVVIALPLKYSSNVTTTTTTATGDATQVTDTLIDVISTITTATRQRQQQQQPQERDQQKDPTEWYDSHGYNDYGVTWNTLISKSKTHVKMET